LLTSTDEMFRFGAWDAFGTGVAAAQSVLFFITASLVVSWMMGGLIGDKPAAIIVLASVALAATAAAAVVSIVTWRATFAALVRGVAPTGTVHTACAL